MKIYFLVATQHNNLGDLLINKMLIDELSYHGTVYVDAAGLPESFKKVVFNKEGIKDFEKEYGGSLKRLSGIKLLSKIKSGFDLYFKSPGPSGDTGYDFKSLARLGVLAFQFNYLSKGRIKLNLVGNDIIVASKLDRCFQKITNKAFKNYLVRSKANRDQLLALGYKNIGFIPDVAFLYDNNGLKKNKDKVCISFRDLKDENYQNQIILFLKKAIPHFTNQDLKIEFFYQVESDYSFNKFLFQKFNADNVTFRADCLMYNQIPYYNEVKYVLTNRLHVMILGIVHNALPLLLLNSDSKTSKINRIITDNKLDHLIVKSFEDITADHNYEKNISKLKEVTIKNKNTCEKLIKGLI